MPSIVGHFTIPLAVRYARDVPKRLVAAGLVAAMLPDADTAGLLLRVPVDSLFGHRGITHSLVFAVFVAALAAAGSHSLRASRTRASAFVFACAASHPLLDMLTNGGPGVMLAWPLSQERMFAPWRPIEVSPIGMGFFSLRGLRVVASELAWVVLPAVVAAWLARRSRAWNAG